MALPKVVNKLTGSAIVIAALWCLGIASAAWAYEHSWDAVGAVLLGAGWPLPLAVYVRWAIT